MPSQKKIALKEEYSEILGKYPEFILTRYQGMNVEKISALRKSLREENAPFKIIKNNIFRKLIEENTQIEGVNGEKTFVGPIGVAFTNNNMPAVAKVLTNFSKENEAFTIISGVMGDKYYDKAAVDAIANMPSKEQSIATIMAGLNTPARNIASLMNQIMSSLARGIKAVGEKNG